MRRLTNTEYAATLTDVLGTAQGPLIDQLVSGFPSETESLGFRNNASFLDVSDTVAQKYLDAADQLSSAIGTSLVHCASGQEGTRACAQGYLAELGPKLYRRPLSADETTRLLAMFDGALASYDFATGIEWLTFALLQSPSFLHRVELGIAAPPGTPVTQPDNYEMATRLSYLLWHSAPDAALMTAAAQGKLQTPDEIRGQAARMLDDPKAHRAYHFFEEWLDVDQLGAFSRDRNIFPNLPSTLPALFAGETQAFVEDLLFGAGPHDLKTLLTAPYTFANADLARHYGLSGPSGAAFEKVAVDPATRLGVLTQGGVVSVHDKPTRSSIVRRGLKIRTDLLCQTVGAPPGMVPALGEPTPGVTQKQRLEMHRQNPTCNACHALMDPIGIAIDGIDPVGRVRSKDETGTAIDSTSMLDHTRDADGPIASGPDLARRLSSSQEVSHCFVTQLFRYAYGRAETPADACTLERLNQRFTQSGGDIKDLLIGLTETDAFLYRPVME